MNIHFLIFYLFRIHCGLSWQQSVSLETGLPEPEVRQPVQPGRVLRHPELRGGQPPGAVRRRWVEAAWTILMKYETQGTFLGDSLSPLWFEQLHRGYFNQILEKYKDYLWIDKMGRYLELELGLDNLENWLHLSPLLWSKNGAPSCTPWLSGSQQSNTVT